MNLSDDAAPTPDKEEEFRASRNRVNRIAKWRQASSWRIEIVIINRRKEPDFEEEPAQDVLEIITVFSARLYGARSRKHPQHGWTPEIIPNCAQSNSIAL